MLKILRSGRNLGDVAALKLTILSSQEGSSRFREHALEQEALCFQELKLANLERMPDGSFGKEYFDFMKRNGLQPFNFSGEVRALYNRFPVSMRYIRLHDMFHTLLGFEADMAGEFGVYAFVGKQDYTSVLTRASRAARIFAKLIFWKTREMTEALEKGHRLSEGAEDLIAQPLESMLQRPLGQVRLEMGLKL